MVSPTLPRSSTGCVYRARLVAVEKSGPPAVATCYAAQCLTSRLDTIRVQAASSITHVTHDLRDVPDAVILVTGLSDTSRVRVEPALSESSENWRQVWSKLGARCPEAGQHVIRSNQRYLMREGHG